MISNHPSVVVYDAKPYDREYLSHAAGANEIEWLFHDCRLGPSTVELSRGASAVCVFVNDVVNREVLESLAAMQVGHVALRCAGFNNVDLVAAKEAGICVSRVPSYSPHAVAEHTIALLLALNRKIHRAYNRVRDLNFSLSGLVGFDLHGKTAGVIGTGRTGRIVGEILRGFGMNVLACDVAPDQEWAGRFQIDYVSPQELAKRSDVITLHAPLTPETHHLVNSDSLALTKPGVILVNVSRGGLINTTDLIRGLKSGHVGGVALDVYEEEEGVFFEDLSGTVLQDDELARLLTFPNVLVTSHQAFLTREALLEIARVTVENIALRFKGQKLLEGTGLS